MNTPLNTLNAAPGAMHAVRVCVGFLAACGTLLLGVSSAHASGAGEGPEQNAPRKEDSRNQSRQERQERDARSFEARAEEHRRVLQENTNNVEMTRRVGRMTADERRDLRRQINEAGQEVYALPPRR